ncbi:hypothetical protein [Rhizobium hainanense]|uniref:Uncharacterized protein n=1 Tax=Rhizobium hainanense TaxID=52131 RepID=A0A1C3WJN0_9HYPH|nr:hypothetical protein [Rhizobium hainanense]SCB39934.1 hypothetical protein GA0061100_12126 [Rhizobium hainanense]
MSKYGRLSGDELSLTIDRTLVVIEGERLIISKQVASAVEFLHSVGHRQLADTHLPSPAMREPHLGAMEEK